jgi:hypothetical protein
VLEEVQAVLVEQLDDLGRVDIRELLADATFIRPKKGVRTPAKPRLAKA